MRINIDLRYNYSYDDSNTSDSSISEEFNNNSDESIRERDTGIGIALQYLTREADYEHERKRSFDNRAGITIAFLSTLLIAFVKADHFPTLTAVATSNTYANLLYALFVIFDIATVISLIWTIWGFIGVIRTRTLQRLEVDDLNAQRDLERTRLMGELCDTTERMVELNRSVNEKIAKRFKKSVKRIKITIGMMLASFLVYLILICMGNIS